VFLNISRTHNGEYVVYGDEHKERYGHGSNPFEAIKDYYNVKNTNKEDPIINLAGVPYKESQIQDFLKEVMKEMGVKTYTDVDGETKTL